MNASNSDVFTTVVKPIVDAAVNGFNGTVFAYGQTSSGKTYTMMGTPDEPGIIPLAVEYMFDAIASTARREFLLRVSYLEIYNERVNDLLNTSNTDLKLKEDSSGQIILLCKEEITNCPENVLSIMKKGNKNKRIGETNMNERSSRSHTIFRITIESRETGGSSEGAIQVSQLNLVDLAGSERARQTGATGERFKEGRHINLSLSTLGLVIMQLSDSQDTQKHVNFRDSKLTRLLQNSLGGNAMTAIICAVTSAALEETQCTLSFASRAKSVKNKPHINEVMSDAALLTRYAKQLSKLQAELEKMKSQNRCAEVEEMETKLQEKDRINQLLEERIEMLKTRIVSGDTTTEETFKSKCKRRQTWGGPGVSSQHLPVFKPTNNLPTIRETSFEKPHRKSIIQSADLMNQTFQTAFTDFELELFESERDRVNEETFTDSDEEPFVTKRNTHRVTFRDDVFTIRAKSSTSPEETSIEVTPEKCSMSTQTASYQASPSTPTHTLRQYICTLANDYKELLEFTTLEKQLLCHENHCCVHEGEVRNKAEYSTEVKERLERLNLARECNIDRIITELCDKLDEADAKSRQDIDSNKKKVKQFAELQKQIQNITSEKDEFEYMSRELRAQLKAKTTELDLKIMYEENMKEPEFKRIAELEKQMDCLVSEKEMLERVNAELRTESTKKIAEVQKQLEYVTSERDEFQHMRQELRVELNKTSLELQKLKNDPASVREEMIVDIKELEKRIEDVTSEKSKLERVNAELNDRVLELEATVTSEQTARREVTEQVSKLQGEIQSVTVEKNEFERVKTELDHAVSELKLEITSQESEAREARGKISELESRIESVMSERNELQRVNTEMESKIVVEQTASQDAMVKVCELKKQIEDMASEKNEFERLSGELNRKIAELQSQIVSERTANQNGIERTSQLEVEIESITSERNELQRINTELDQKTSELESKIAAEQTTSQTAMERISQLEVEIESVTLEKTELERINVELSQKTCDFESKIVVEQNAAEKVREMEKQIGSITSEKNEFERLNGELNRKITELESQMISERTASQNGMENISQLKVQIESVTSEKNEFECLNGELIRKITELELQMISEQTASQGAAEKICELEKQIEGVIFEKNEFERLSGELNRKITELELQMISEQTASQGAAEKICELEKQIEGVIFEKNEFERLSGELNRKITELESQMISEQTASQGATEKISQLKVQIETVTTEKNEFERLNGELNRKNTELESQMISEQTASQGATEKISQLKVQIETVTTEKNEFERLSGEMNRKITELESQIISEQTASQGATEKICDLEKQIEGVIFEKNEFERLSGELNRKIAELESQTISEQNTSQGATEKICELKKQIDDMASEKNEFERLNGELNRKIAELESQIISEQTASQGATEKICDLEKQIEGVIFEKNEFGRLSGELNRKITELESQIVSEQTASRSAMESNSELCKEIENLVSEKKELERVNSQLRDGLDIKPPVSEEGSDRDYINENNNLKVYIKDLQNMLKTVPTENQDRKDQMEDQSLLLSCSRFNESNADVSSLMMTMEAERSQLEETLHLKSAELDEIKGDVRSLKMDIENLQKAIYLLTTENMDMATKLTTEQETAKQAELNLQKTIDELYARISHVTSEKINLESDLASLEDQLVSMRSRVPETHSEDQLFATYQSKIDKLTEENIELSASIAEKNKELENVKESKSLLYDHDCIYREKVAVLTQEKKSLLVENSELSSDLIDKIEDNDSLKEQCDILKSKVEQSLAMKDNAAGNDLEHLESENNVLKTELAELKRKVAILSDENVKFSSNLLETMESLDSSRNEGSGSNTLHLSTIVNKTGEEVVQEETREALTKQVTTLQDKIDHLTRLNKKLSDLKLTSCSQCAHLKNLNDSRRALKLETKALNHKLEDLQRKFEHKCADTETLKKQLYQGLNLSAQCVSPNVSFGDEMNISFVEEKIQSLNEELQAMRVDHDKLSVMYKDKCSEHEQLQTDLISDETSLSGDSTKSERRNRIEQIQKHIDCLRGEMDKLNGNSVNFATMLDQFKQDKANLTEQIKVLRATNEELRQKVSDESTAAEKVRILENELTTMSNEIEQFSAREKELETQRLLLEVELEDLKDEKKTKSSLIDQLNQHISSLKYELDLATSQKNELAASNTGKDKYIEQLEFLKKHCEELEVEQVRSLEVGQHAALRIKELEAYIERLQQSITQHEGLCKDLHERGLHLENLLQESEQEKAQAVENELTEFKTNLEIRYKHEFNSMSLEYEQRVKESENNLQKLNDTLNKYVEENLNMTQEVTRLRNIEEKFIAMRDEKERVSSTGKTLSSDNEKLSEELNYVRKCMMTELRSLRCDITAADLSNKSVNEIFLIFLQTLLSKEKEVMRTMRETFEKDKQKLVDERQQSADTEKRATIWAKELEAEIEKLQADLTERERAQKEYQNKISQLEQLLTEGNHEKEILKEKMQGLETDFHNLQTDFDKQCKVDTRQEEAIFVAQKREKEVQEIFKHKETQLQSTLRLEKEMHAKKISDLAYTIESYKTKILELNSTIEGLEVNEKQLKNIIEANSAEMRKKNHNIEKLNAKLEQLTEAYNEMSQEMEQKTLHVKQITVILKNKCDLLAEYKIKLEAVTPEHEMLKEHVRDQKTAIERYKEEIETLKKETEAQLEVIKDKLNTKEIQNAGLTKQLNELSNRNVALIEELNELKGKYEELQQTNAKLERKIRNSTSKIKAEAEIEELKELNKRLQTNLEGASNRVTEVQEIKNKTLKELVDLQGKHELLSQENNETKKALASYKSKYNASSLLLSEGKYDALLLEKNRVALELEDKKLLLSQKDKELEERASKIQQLTEKNKEFDNELDEYAAIIQERDVEISKLEDKLYSRLTENTHINELEEKLKGFREENEKLRDRAETLEIRLHHDMEQTREDKARTEMAIHTLKKEKLELQAKLNECKKQLELGLKETSMGQSSNSKKKVQSSMEGECNRVTELQDQQNKMVNEFVNLKRQYDLLLKENIELKGTLAVYESKRSGSKLSKDAGKLDSVLKEKNNLEQELEAHKLLLNQKDRELKEYVNRTRDLIGENKEHGTGRDVGSSKLESGSVIDLKEKLRTFREENRMLKNVTKELQLKLNACSERVPLNEESTGKKVGASVPNKELGEYKEKCKQLKRQMHELELQLVSKNGKIATLEIQIQSENFPYQRKCKELEEHLLAFRSKNAELNSEVRKLQKVVNDVNAWECDICRRWRVNRKDQVCQTIPNDALRFCSTNSGIVGDHLKIQKLEKEKALMKELCRSRSRRVKELESMVKELEEAQSSAVSRQHLLTDNST
ncbi:uncharacterized protein LOC143365939 isoform X2 [Andrena cerasifolii]